MPYFYPRSPCGERRCGCFARCRFWAYFYPRSPCGERHDKLDTIIEFIHFYPRSPCGERLLLLAVFMKVIDFYPRSPCGERQHHLNMLDYPHNISIHALLAESDVVGAPEGADSCHISIHALLAESDSLGSVRGCFFCVFLSTLSLRRATVSSKL